VAMTTEEMLVPAAVTEFSAAKEHGASDHEAWRAAVERVRYEVLRMAAMACELHAVKFDPESPQALAYRDCAHMLRDLV
jgi:hypothetical protein